MIRNTRLVLPCPPVSVHTGAMQNNSGVLSVLFISCHLEEGPEAVPLGAASVAACLKGSLGSAVSIRLAETYVNDGAPGIVSAALLGRENVIGFSMYTWNREIMTAAAKSLREKNSSAFLFCGGPEATALPEGLTVPEGGPFDAVIPGEGELAALELINRIAAGKEITAVFPKIPIPLDELVRLPSPWLNGTLNAEDRRGILWELARGCPYNCTYCYESKGEKTLRYFSDERIFAELSCFAAAKPDSVFVLDPTFNTNKERANRILETIIKTAPDIHWHFEVRGELITREQARLFSRLHTSLQIGLQSQDPKVCALAGRTFNRDLFTSRIGLLHEAGVSFGLDLIYGLPGDSLQGYKKSLDFALSLYPDNLDMFRLSVLPGTLMYDQAESLGLKASRRAPYGIISSTTFSGNDLGTAERLSGAANLFYNRGRAVAWFNQLLYPLGKKPSQFLEGFTRFLEKQGAPLPADSMEIEKLQLAFLERSYQEAKKEYLLPVVWDTVRLHGAWGRALAEGLSTVIECSYHYDDILNPETLDIEELIEELEPFEGTVRVDPSPVGPVYSFIQN